MVLLAESDGHLGEPSDPVRPLEVRNGDRQAGQRLVLVR